MTKPQRIIAPTGDYGDWRQRSEWGGAEAPRLLFNTLVGNPGLTEGLLGDLLTYRGINLPRLFEGTWITLTWPEWFSELAVLENMVLVHSGEPMLLENPSFVHRAAAQCVQIRHPETVFTARVRWPLSEAAHHIPPAAYRFLRLGRNLLRAALNLRSERVECGGSRCAFFPWSTKIAPHILPVAKTWGRRNNEPVFLAGWNQEAPIDIQEGWVWSNLSREISLTLILEAWRADVQLKRNWHLALKEGRFSNLANWRGWDMRPLVIPTLNAVVDELFPTILRVLCAEAWCRAHSLLAAVLPLDGSAAARSVVAGARLAGTLSFSVQYGLTVDNPEIAEPFEDMAFLSGSTTHSWFMQRGASAQKLTVVGTTAYDHILEMLEHRETLRQQLANKVGLRPAFPLVLVATWHVQAVYPENVKNAELALIFESLSQIQNAQVIVKLHPSDQDGGKLETSVAARFNLPIHIIDSLLLNEHLVLCSDLMICNYTTLGLMAVLVETPLIIVDLGLMQKPPYRSYVDEGVASFADNRVKMDGALKEALSGRTVFWGRRERARASFISTRLFKNDGHSADRICDVIQNHLSCE